MPMHHFTRIPGIHYIKTLVLTSCLWFGIPPYLQDADSLLVSEETQEAIHQYDRWVSHSAPDFYILDLYFDSLLEHSIDDIDEHSVTLPVEDMDDTAEEEKGI